MAQRKLGSQIKNSTNVRLMDLKRSIFFASCYLLWLVIPALVRRFVLKQFFVPRKYKPQPKEQESLNLAEKFELLVDDQKLKCWRWGSGPAIIFAHGWSGIGAQFYRFVEKATQAGYSCVAFDGPAHGESEGETATYFQMTNAVRAVIKYCHPDDVKGIVGHSFGASAIIHALSKERLQTPAVLIAPALKLKELLEGYFNFYGVPLTIYNTLISEFEEKYGYSLTWDNPVNLIRQQSLKALIIHDSEDKVTSFADSKVISAKYDSLNFYGTTGLGHKRVLKDSDVIQKTLDYLLHEIVPVE